MPQELLRNASLRVLEAKGKKGCNLRRQFGREGTCKQREREKLFVCSWLTMSSWFGSTMSSSAAPAAAGAPPLLENEPGRADGAEAAARDDVDGLKASVQQLLDLCAEYV